MRSGAGSMGCAPTADALLDRPRIAWSTRKPGILVSGVVPDAVSHLVLHVAHGAPQAITPRAGFFNLQVDGGLDRLTYRDAAGADRSIPLSDPDEG